MTVKGFVEIVHHRQIRGWAYAPGIQPEQLLVVAECGERQIGASAADLFRQDLADDAIGGGYHGFVINLDESLADDELSQVSVFAMTGPSDRTRLPQAASAPPAAEPTVKAQARLTLEPVDMSQHPVFVLGAARSGTSGLAQALLKSGWYEGEEEGFLNPLLGDLINVVHQHYARTLEEQTWDTAIRRVPKSYFTGSLRAVFADLARQLYPTGRWVDKTPVAAFISLAPTLQEIWPNARFVFMRRRAIENILSRQRKFPEIGFKEHCLDWARAMSAWLEVRDKLGCAAMELDQVAVARDPHAAGASLIAFLGVPDSFGTRLLQGLAYDRPETTSDVFGSVTDLEEVDWSDEDKLDFMVICGDLFADYGYSLDRSYFAAA
jgi:hypothetical protein